MLSNAHNISKKMHIEREKLRYGRNDRQNEAKNMEEYIRIYIKKISGDNSNESNCTVEQWHDD